MYHLLIVDHSEAISLVLHRGGFHIKICVSLAHILWFWFFFIFIGVPRRFLQVWGNIDFAAYCSFI